MIDTDLMIIDGSGLSEKELKVAIANVSCFHLFTISIHIIIW